MLLNHIHILLVILLFPFYSLASSHYKLDVCNDVLTDLCEVWGISSDKGKPVIKWRKSMSSLPLWSNSDEIKIHEPFYDICASLGKDSLAALAIMLGHELHHIISKDGTRFKKGIKNLSDKSIETEYEADIAGAFTAYLADYKTKGIMSRVFEKMYEAYEFKDKGMNDYPSLKLRKSIAGKVDKEVDKMILWFESATYLTAMGEYAMAIELLECLVIHYPNAEIYNNLGVAQSLLALRLDHEMMPYAMPFELETDSELFRKGSKVLGFTPADAPLLIKSAIGNFKKARKLAKGTKEIASINLISAYILNKEFDKTNGLVKNKYRYSENGKNSIDLLQGIIYALKGKENHAIQKWNNAALNPKLENIAKYNKQVIRTGVPFIDKDIPKKRLHFINESLTGTSNNKSYPLCPGKNLVINTKQQKTVKSLEIIWSESNAVNIFVYKQKPELNSVRKLKDIKIKYPNHFSIPTRKGQIIRVPEQHLLFILNKESVVVWVKYNR